MPLWTTKQNAKVPYIKTYKEWLLVSTACLPRRSLRARAPLWRAVSSHSSHLPQEVLLAQFSLYVDKSGLKPDSFHFIVPLVNIQYFSIQYLYVSGWSADSSDLSHVRYNFPGACNNRPFRCERVFKMNKLK